MSVDFVSRTYYWLAYGPFSAAEGQHQFLTDAPNPLPTGDGFTLRELPLPSWWPAKALITRFATGWGLATDPHNAAACNYSAWIDPKSVAFNSSHGAEAHSDYTRDIPLAQGISPLQYGVVCEKFDYPVPFDRTIGDRLFCIFNCAADLSYGYAGITFLVPTLFQPVALNNDY